MKSAEQTACLDGKIRHQYLPQAGFRKADLRLRVEYRVRKTDEYSSVFTFRRSIRGRYFVLHYRPNHLPMARLGLVVSRKLARFAVSRNLVKRLAREHFRHVRDSLPCHDLALRLAQKIDQATRTALREDIASLFARLPR